MDALLHQVGGLLESQTRDRIANEKKDPKGKDWVPWSENYAKTRHSGHSLLQNEGDMLDSIQYVVSSGSVEVGTNMVYGKTQQYGRPKDGIPARPFLGLSDDNIEEINDEIESWLRDEMGLLL